MLKKSIFIGLMSSWACASYPPEFEIQTFLEAYCISCHGKDKVKGNVDLSQIRTEQQILEKYKLWENIEELVAFEDMPPSKAKKQPNQKQRDALSDWYQYKFVTHVQAHPGFHQPRLLSLYEYENTITDLLGYQLVQQVEKTDATKTTDSLIQSIMYEPVRGKSGFTNDTHGQSLSFEDWLNYSYIADSAVISLFSKGRSAYLARYSGSQPETKISYTQAKRLVLAFAAKAYRRSLNRTEQRTFSKSISRRHPEQSAQQQIKKILVSPAFLFRGFNAETVIKDGTVVSDTELAQRLSYFLWGTMPDDKLLAMANNNELTQGDNLKTTLTRMLNDPKAGFLSERLATEWFGLDGMTNIVKGTVSVTTDLKAQPIAFMRYLINQNRPILELIDSDVTYANRKISHYYSASDVSQFPAKVIIEGLEVVHQPLVKVSIKDSPMRGGIMTMPGILAMNSAPNATSPIVRGAWLLEKVLGEHLGEPPPDVPPLAPPNMKVKMSFRQRFSEHRKSPTCSLCHNKIDPLGFTLESFDPLGMVRTFEDEIVPITRFQKKQAAQKALTSTDKKIPIDTSGTLPSGEKFSNIIELKDILVHQHGKKIVKNVTERFLSYALNRKLQLYDQPTVNNIVNELITGPGTYQQLIELIVTSLPFTHTVSQDNTTKEASNNA